MEILYHKAPDWLIEDILENGLDPRFADGRVKVVYLSKQPAKRRIGTLLEIDASLLDEDKLEVEQELTSGQTNYRYYGKVPAEAIKVRSD